MLRLLIDENFDYRIVRGLKARLPKLDFVLAKDAGLSGLADSMLLSWAAREHRAILTHDVNTMIHHAKQLQNQRVPMPKVILVPDRLSIGYAINDLEILVECLTEPDLRDQILFLPL